MLAIAEVQQKLRQSFHWFELYLGVVIAIAATAAIAVLLWEHLRRRRQRDTWRTKDNLEASVDGSFLARLLGDVSPLDWLLAQLPHFHMTGPACREFRENAHHT